MTDEDRKLDIKMDEELLFGQNFITFPYIRDMQIDDFYMQRCIELARLGEGYVAPNPMVGAVIVFEDKILGEGYHQLYGQAHAEVNAVNAVKDKSLLKDATIYVSLEPCAHFGKTPPCSDLLVTHKFKRVVIGCQDTFSAVSGKGIQKLIDNGIEVQVGVLEKECRELNKRFFTFHEKKRPYIILKWAQTKDGYLDKLRTIADKGVNWISSPETKVLVHKWRSQEQSILVGKNTVLNDNPSLTVRELTGKNPIRIILDSHCKIDKSYAVLNNKVPSIILNLDKNESCGSAEWIRLRNMEINTILETLYAKDIQSVFVEGGTSVLHSFIQNNSWDEARVIIGNTFFSEGSKAPVIADAPVFTFQFSTDIINYYIHK